MRRRTYLSSGAGLLAGIAGCTSTSPTEGAAQNQSTTSEPAGEVVVQDATLHSGETEGKDGGFQTGQYVGATVTNQREHPTGYVNVSVDWYDERGDFLDTSENGIPSLGAGERWAARIYVPSHLDSVSDFDLSGDVTLRLAEPPENVELVSSSFNPDQREPVTGRVKNNTGSELSDIGVIAKLYDEDGTVLGGAGINQTGIPASETWRFSIRFFNFYRTQKAVRHEAFLDSGY